MPSEITLLSNLYWLYLNDNELTGSLPSGLIQMTSLWVLDVSNNPNMSGPLPNDFSALPTWLNRLQVINITNDSGLSGTIPQTMCATTTTATTSDLVAFDCRSGVLCGCDCPC